MCIFPDLRSPNEEMCPWLELDRLIKVDISLSWELAGLGELRRLSLLSRHVDNGNTFIFFIFFPISQKKSTSDHTIRDMNPGPLGPNQTPRAAQWGLMMKLGGGFAGI